MNTGEFTFDYIRVGQYSIVIEVQGVQRFSATGLTCRRAKRSQDVSMEVGNVTESVAVTAPTPLVMRSLRSNSRPCRNHEYQSFRCRDENFTGPSTVEYGRDAGRRRDRLNGTGNMEPYLRVDGTPATADPENRTSSIRAIGNYINLLSVDAIQEVHVVEGVIAAEYGAA